MRQPANDAVIIVASGRWASTLYGGWTDATVSDLGLVPSSAVTGRTPASRRSCAAPLGDRTLRLGTPCWMGRCSTRLATPSAHLTGLVGVVTLLADEGRSCCSACRRRRSPTTWCCRQGAVAARPTAVATKSAEQVIAGRDGADEPDGVVEVRPTNSIAVPCPKLWQNGLVRHLQRAEQLCAPWCSLIPTHTPTHLGAQRRDRRGAKKGGPLLPGLHPEALATDGLVAGAARSTKPDRHGRPTAEDSGRSRPSTSSAARRRRTTSSMRGPRTSTSLSARWTARYTSEAADHGAARRPRRRPSGPGDWCRRLGETFEVTSSSDAARSLIAAAIPTGASGEGSHRGRLAAAARRSGEIADQQLGRRRGHGSRTRTVVDGRGRPQRAGCGRSSHTSACLDAYRRGTVRRRDLHAGMACARRAGLSQTWSRTTRTWWRRSPATSATCSRKSVLAPRRAARRPGAGDRRGSASSTPTIVRTVPRRPRAASPRHAPGL